MFFLFIFSDKMLLLSDLLLLGREYDISSLQYGVLINRNFEVSKASLLVFESVLAHGRQKFSEKLPV